MKKLVNWIGERSHLFAKLMVAVCLTCGIYFSERSLQILETTGNSAAAELAIIIGFFGGELLFLLLKTIFGDKKKDKASNPDVEGEACYEG